MALTGTRTLTLDTVTITGADVPNVAVTVAMAVPGLVFPLGTAPATETLIPTDVTATTDAQGVAAVDILPSSVVGPYRVSFAGFERVISMPDRDVRLSQLGEAVLPGAALEYLSTDMSNLDAGLTESERKTIRDALGIAGGAEIVTASKDFDAAGARALHGKNVFLHHAAAVTVRVPSLQAGDTVAFVAIGVSPGVVNAMFEHQGGTAAILVGTKQMVSCTWDGANGEWKFRRISGVKPDWDAKSGTDAEILNKPGVLKYRGNYDTHTVYNRYDVVAVNRELWLWASNDLHVQGIGPPNDDTYDATSGWWPLTSTPKWVASLLESLTGSDRLPSSAIDGLDDVGGTTPLVYDLLANGTFDLQNNWASAKNRRVLYRNSTGSDLTLTIRPNAAGTWLPAAAEKGTQIQFHPLWRQGKILIQNLAFARHQSDGSIKKFAKSSTAVNATEGLGEPFALIYADDYYIGSDNVPWHVVPLAQDVRGVLDAYDATVVHEHELKQVESKVDHIIHPADKQSFTLPGWPVPKPIPAGNDRLQWVYNFRPVGGSARIGAEKGEDTVHFSWAVGSFGGRTSDELIDLIRRLDIWDARANIADGVVACHVLPTLSSGVITGSRFSCLVSAYNGKMLQVCPHTWTEDATLQSGVQNNAAILQAYTAASGNHLTDLNRISLSIADSLKANSFRIYGEQADIQRVKDLFANELGGTGRAKLGIVEAGGKGPREVVVDALSATFVGALAGTTYNTELTYVDAAIPTSVGAEGDVIPQFESRIRFRLDDFVPAVWAREGYNAKIPQDLIPGRGGTAIEPIKVGEVFIDIDDSTAGPDDWYATGIQIPDDALFGVTFGVISSVNFLRVDLKWIVREDLMKHRASTAGADIVHTTYSTSAGLTYGNALTIWIEGTRYYHLGRTADGELLFTSSNVSADALPFAVWRLAGGGSGVQASEVATGDVSIRTAYVLFRPAGKVTKIPADGLLIMRWGSNFSGSGRERYVTGTPIVVPCELLRGYGAKAVNDAAGLGADEYAVYQRVGPDGGWVYAYFARTADNELLVASDHDDHDPEPLSIWHMPANSASTPSGQDAPGSGAYSPVGDAVKTVATAISGQNLVPYTVTVRDGATHVEIAWTGASNMTPATTGARIEYQPPGATLWHFLLDADGETMVVKPGEETRYRFSDPFFHANRQLKLRFANTAVGNFGGDAITSDQFFETDANAAAIDPVPLLTRAVVVGSQGEPNTGLGGSNTSLVEFDQPVLWDAVTRLTLYVGTQPTWANEAAFIVLDLDGGDLDYVGPLPTTTDLSGSSHLAAWFSSGWMGLGGNNGASQWLARPSSAFVAEQAKVNRRGVSSRLIGLVKSGVYLTGLRVAAYGGGHQCVIQRAHAMVRA